MTTEKMKAIRFHHFSGTDVLRLEYAFRPEVKPGEVLIRVYAAGVNTPDWYLREGYRALPREWRPNVPFPVTPGSDVSGVVEAVADDVENFVVGDDVFGTVRFPSSDESLAYAEYVAAPASDLAIKPACIDHIRAAGAPMSGLTAWQFLIDVGHDAEKPLQPKRHQPVALDGKTVLINGAAGGVGHFAVQLAKSRGARVIGVSSGAHEAFLRDLGADSFIDCTKAAPEDVVRGVDLVVDAVGGPTAKRLLRVIKRGGALFPIFPHGFDGQEGAASLDITVSATQVRSNGAQLAELARLLESGAVYVAIEGAFPFSDAAAAHQRAAAGHIRGKIVLVVDVPSSDWPPRVVVIDPQNCGSSPSFVRRYHA